MAQDTSFKSDALGQRGRMQGERIAFAGASQLGQGIGQGAKNYVQTVQSEQLLAQKGAEGRVRMMTEQLRQDEIRQKMAMVEQGGMLRMQQLQVEAVAMQNEQMRKQLDREEETDITDQMRHKVVGTPLPSEGGGYEVFSGRGGAQKISANTAQLMMLASGKGRSGPAQQDPGQSFDQMLRATGSMTQLRTNYNMQKKAYDTAIAEGKPGIKPDMSEEEMAGVERAYLRTRQAEGYTEQAVQQATTRMEKDDEVLDHEGSNLITKTLNDKTVRNQLMSLERDYDRKEVFEVSRQWVNEMLRHVDEQTGDRIPRSEIAEWMKDPRWIEALRARLGGG